mgnify:FL=1
MSKNISSTYMIQLPSGNQVHPSRLIHRDGTLMWKHALLNNNVLSVPTEPAVEMHIIKTAQRLEELNSWVSLNLEPWECLTPTAWYDPSIDELANGISLYFKHFSNSSINTYELLLPHIQDYETLELRWDQLYFKRC